MKKVSEKKPASTGRKTKSPAAKPAPVATDPTDVSEAIEATEVHSDEAHVDEVAAEPAKKHTIDDINNQLYREAAQRVLDAIDAGTSIWQKPWNPPSSHRRPFNGHSGLNYLGINRVLLMMEMAANGWTDTRFMTYKQVQSLAQDMKKAGAPDDELPHIRKGSKAITIYKMGRQEVKRDKVDASGKPIVDESGKPVKETFLGKVFLQTYKIFNADHIANLPPMPEVQSKPSFEVLGQIEEQVKKLGVPVMYEPQASAYYEPAADRITVPERSQYKDTVKDGKVVFSGAAKHYSVLLHECCHATGHESRLNRNLTGGRGSDAYRREELTAETASTYLMAELGLESDEVIKQHASYLESWAKMIRDDPKALFQAMSAAEKAADWFMQRHEKQLAAQANVQAAPTMTLGANLQLAPAMTVTTSLASPALAPASVSGGFGAVNALPVAASPMVRVTGLRPIADVVAGMGGPGVMG